MALFNRKKKADSDAGTNDDGSDGKKEKGGWKRPANTAFKQQRLKAWQPILTPKTVLPTLFIVGLLFAPIGGVLIWGSSTVSQITLDYTNCETDGGTSGQFSTLSKYDYQLRSSDAKLPYAPPTYSHTQNDSATVGQRSACKLRFELPADLQPPVFIYYKLTGFHQNHRRYVQSFDTDQLKGKAVSAGTLNGGNCKPLGTINDKPIYPCGLIANSLFNDTISDAMLLSDGPAYVFSQKGIAWPGEAKKYVPKPGYASLDEIMPPPNWAERYPNGYTEDNPPPNLREDEHFQNWMRTAGLPTFSKLYGRNDGDVMQKGTYELTISMNFPVKGYGGTKSIVISTVSWIGGKNPFLGWAYVGAAALFVLLAVAGTVRHIVKPRKLGDMSLLSWNQPLPAGR